ncbi:MAG: glycosyl hydrolase family 28-related protein, partial [Chthonomonadales bacterium]
MHNKLKFLIPFVALILMTCGGTPVYASALFYGAGSAGTRPHIPKPAALAKFEAGGVTGAALEYVGHVWESTNVAAGFKFQPYWYQQGTASTNMTAVASSLGAINVKTAPYNCKGNGVTDDTAGIQKALNDSIVNHKTVLAPDGTYVITSTLTYVLPGGSTFNAGPKIVGNGSTSSIFLNHVVGGPMIKFDVNASNGAYNVIHGAKIQGIQIRGSGNSYANSDGIYMRRTYFADLNDVYISDLSGNGIVFYNGDTVSGDNDACYNVAISNSHIDKCKKWGVTFQNPTGGIAYNQTSNFDMRNLWVSQCGIKMGANADGSGSGSIQFN